MQNEKMSNVASELDEIFKYLEYNILEKIPKELKRQVKSMKNPDYKFNLDKNKELNDQNLMEETRKILSAIYIKYCCTEDEAEAILEKHNMLESEKEEVKIGLDNLQQMFNNYTKNNSCENTKTEMLQIEVLPWYSRMINKIKSFFGVKK